MSQAPQASPLVLPLPGGREGASVTLQPLLCAEMRGPRAWFEREPGLGGTLRALGIGVPRDELIRIPIVAFLLEHPTAGAILIDTGFIAAIASGPPAERRRNLGPMLLMARDVAMRAEQTVAAQLRARGLAPERIETVVMTHLHFDHASALADFPGASVIVSAPEWRAAQARGAGLQGYPRAQLDPRPRYRTIDFHAPPAAAHGPFARALDLFGDGAIVLLDTPGHSAGHMSVLLRLSGGREALIAGDAIYTLATLREGRRPWRCQNREAFERSVAMLAAYDRENPDALIVPGHDMAHWETLAERYE